jgi:hypothetical protein
MAKELAGAVFGKAKLYRAGKCKLKRARLRSFGVEKNTSMNASRQTLGTQWSRSFWGYSSHA